MHKRQNKFWSLTALLLCTIALSYGQTRIDTVHLKQGSVLDILWLSQRPDSQAQLKAYFEDVIPVGQHYSYASYTSFGVADHTQGNHRPSTLILGGWSSLEQREAFSANILTEVPDFHERRRSIFSYFALSYHEMAEEQTLIIDRSRYLVATAYWLNETQHPQTWVNRWEEAAQAAGGQVLLPLQKGTSIFGYPYQPNYFVLSSWENAAAFEAFQAQQPNPIDAGVQHVNELILQ